MQKLLLALMGACCAVPSTAFAQVYAGLELGYASADFPLGSPYNGVVDDRAAVVGAEVGLAIKRRLAIELGFNKYNSFDGRATPCAPGAVCSNVVAPTGSNDVTSYNFSFIPHFDVGEVELFAELGYYHAKIDTEIGIPADDDFNDDGIIAGVGARWYFTQPWSVSLEASRLDDNIYQIMVGVGWGLRRGSRAERPEPRDAD